jgi:hypothetical protein
MAQVFPENGLVKSTWLPWIPLQSSQMLMVYTTGVCVFFAAFGALRLPAIVGFLAVAFLALFAVVPRFAVPRFAVPRFARVTAFFAVLLGGRFAAAFFSLGLAALALALVAFFFALLDLLGFAMVASFPDYGGYKAG